MRFALTEDQRAFAAAVRDFCAKECRPEALRAAWASDTGWSRERWSGLAGLGVTGMTVPEEHGGLGFGEPELVAVLEETGRVALPEPLTETVAVAAPLLAAVGGDAAARWLPAIAAGEAVVSTALAGAPYVLFADSCEALLIEHGDELHLVESGAVGVDPQPSVDRARRLSRVAWEPSDATRLGEDAGALLGLAADRGALAAAAQLIGVGAHLIEVTVGYAKERQQFGQPIGGFQAVKHHLADSLLLLEFARPAVHRAAWSVVTDAPTRGRDVSMAKAYASDAAERAARVALQVHGAIGYTFEFDLHLWMKRAWALAAAWGDAAHHRRRVADAIL